MLEWGNIFLFCKHWQDTGAPSYFLKLQVFLARSAMMGMMSDSKTVSATVSASVFRLSEVSRGDLDGPRAQPRYSKAALRR